MRETCHLAPLVLERVLKMSRQNSTPSRTLSGVIQPVRIGFVPLADCAPLLVAQELGLFQKHGVMVQLSCEVGWATVREKLLYRQLDAAHAIAGLALAMRTGISTPPMPVVAPFVFNLHGNAITLGRDLWNRGVRDAGSLRKLLRSSPGRVLTLGVVSRFSSHAFLLRRWLETGGIVDHDQIRVVVLPPTQMAANLAAGLIDGYCVGEPWNSVAVAEGHGWIAATSEQLAPEHPEKVLLFSENFVSDHHDQAAAIITALTEACAWCDEKANRPEVVRILVGSGWFSNCHASVHASLVGPLDLGTGQSADAASFHIFHRRDANSPTSARGQWLVQEFMSQGLVSERHRAATYAALAAAWTLLSQSKIAKGKTQRAANKKRALETSITALA
jgi:NitT/TauT family transport system ATP-binding protein